MARNASVAMSLALVSAALLGVGQIEAADVREVLYAEIPEVPPRTTVGGEVAYEVTVGVDGHVTEARTLRSTPPYTSEMREALVQWRFDRLRPVEDRREEKLLVVGVFRSSAPESALPGPGEGPANVAISDNVPMPVALEEPDYPPRAMAQGTALLQISVGPQGVVSAVGFIDVTTGFEDVVRRAVEQWTFDGTGRNETVYAVVVMPQLEIAPPESPESGTDEPLE